jgi:hypothetical protein
MPPGPAGCRHDPLDGAGARTSRGSATAVLVLCCQSSIQILKHNFVLQWPVYRDSLRKVACSRFRIATKSSSTSIPPVDKGQGA